MFTEQELNAITEMCSTEKIFLELTERRGVPTSAQQALVSVIRAKAFEEVHRMQKAAAVPAAPAAKERKGGK